MMLFNHSSKIQRIRSTQRKIWSMDIQRVHNTPAEVDMKLIIKQTLIDEV